MFLCNHYEIIVVVVVFKMCRPIRPFLLHCLGRAVVFDALCICPLWNREA